MKVETTSKFKIVTSDEGYVLTNYEDGQDVIEYNSFMSCYCPLNCDLTHIREISAKEDAVLCEERDKAIGYDNTKEYAR